MTIIPVTSENAAEYIRYCRSHGAEHDESYLPDERFVPTEDFPAYLLMAGDDAVGAVGLMRTEPYRSKGKARLTILHSIDASTEAYALLLAAIRPHTEDLHSVYGFLPEAKAKVRQCWEDLDFEIERFAYLLAYRSQETPEVDIHEGFSLTGLSPDDESGVRELCDLWNANYGHKELAWHDVMVRLTGPITIELQAIFVTDWHQESHEVLTGPDIFVDPVLTGDVPAQTLPSGPIFPVENYQRLVVSALHGAQRRVIRAMLGGIELTDEQYDQIAAIWKSAQEKAEKDPHSRMEIYERANQQMIQSVLTPEQQKKMRENSGRTWHGTGGNPHHKGSPMDSGGQKPLPDRGEGAKNQR